MKRRFMQLFVLVFVVGTIVIQPTANVVAQTNQPDETYRGDAVQYAQDFNVSVDEAIRRLNLQEKIALLDTTLQQNEPDQYGGLYIDNGQTYRIVIQLLKGSKKDILHYITDPQISNAVEIKHVPNSHKLLSQTQAKLDGIRRSIGLPSESLVDVMNNVVTLYVNNRLEFENAITQLHQQLPPNVILVEKPIVTDTATTWYGGLTLSGCTTGFTIKSNATGTRYASTAGHCYNSVTPLTVATNFYNPDNGYDFEALYVVSPDTATNLVRDNIPPYYHSITSAINSTPAINTVVCKYGKVTGYGCGTIKAVNISINSSPGVYFRVDRSGSADFICQGDSGGPVYAGNIAYGLVKAATDASCTGHSVDGYMMPVTQIQANNFSVVVIP